MGTVAIQSMPALGFLEVSSISRGLYLTDVIIKKAPVTVLVSQPISSGKHVVLYFGDVASVEESHASAREFSDNCLLREIFIPAVHSELSRFFSTPDHFSKTPVPEDESVAIIESTTLAGAILSADKALKAANVSLRKMRLGQGIGGKAYFVLGGKLEEVQAAAGASEVCLNELDSYCRMDIIPRPDVESLRYF